jgi:radical SAM protein with 4Fe4S-binding SPASM domain
MFDYKYFNDLIRRLVVFNSGPMQVELHPGNACDDYNCRFCYGKNQELNTCDLKGKVRFIHLSGIRSDPLNSKQTYDIIKRIKENGQKIGISTKGLLLNHDLSSLLNTKTSSGDFITFSIDASDEKIYNSIHGVNKHKDLFYRVKKNIRYLYYQKRLVNSSLSINASCLLFRENSSYKQMDRFVNLFGPISDIIRFSLPQVPNKATEKPDYFLDSLENVQEIVKDLKKIYPDIHITFLDFNDPAHLTSFCHCYSQRFNAVIDHCGYIYPCPQIATKEFLKVAYGNIKNKDFWEIWDSDDRRRILDMKVDQMECRICDRKDEAINVELSKVFNNERVN